MRSIQLLSITLISVIPALATAQPAPLPGESPTEPAPVEPVPPTPPVPVTPPVVEPTVKPPEPKAEKKPDEKKEKPWYERLAIRGYMQLRFNRLYATEDAFKNDLGDKQIAENNSFSLRRARLVISGDVAPFLAVYLQAEFAGASVAMRDWYGDVFLDKKKEFRIRAGQSKVPYGFENLQSSQNRAPLDRSDPINSGVSGERDLGLFGYWTPEAVRKRFKHLVDRGLKGTGDYGVVGIGVYSGQGINVTDKNENRHVIARVSYPFVLGKQILELGGGGYVGKFNVTKKVDPSGLNNFRDLRAIASVALYPQPIGFQAEYTLGEGPELVGGTVEVARLQGGYAMVIAHAGDFFPFVRGAFYDGGIKNVDDSQHHVSKELVFGTEWHFKKRIELTAEVDHAKREVGAAEVWGTIVRLQAQLNY